VAATLRAILDAGLGFMPVTYADKWDGPNTVASLRALRLPPSCTVWLDVEGIGAIPPADVIAKINAWAAAVFSAGYVPGLYVGAGCPLTSQELYEIPDIVRYWKGQSRITDRFGALAEPMCGWCMTQLFPHVPRGGVDVDVDVIGQDYQQRVPAYVMA
jgi:hypothetical protein